MKKELLVFVMFYIMLNLFANNSPNFPEGVFVPDYFSKQSFFQIKNDGTNKYIDYDSIFISYSFRKYDFGYFYQDGTMPYLIISKETDNNKLILNCCRLDPYWQGDLKEFVDKNNKNLVQIIITIIDEGEIIFDQFGYPKGTHFYCISSPARIPPQNAILNDSRVRLRVKPNLDCDTWALLEKGTKCVIKDKSSEPYEIDGESWYWYRVDAEGYPDGWVYGKYLDIGETDTTKYKAPETPKIDEKQRLFEAREKVAKEIYAKKEFIAKKGTKYREAGKHMDSYIYKDNIVSGLTVKIVNDEVPLDCGIKIGMRVSEIKALLGEQSLEEIREVTGIQEIPENEIVYLVNYGGAGYHLIFYIDENKLIAVESEFFK